MSTPQDRFPMEAFLARLDRVFAEQRGPEVARALLNEGVRRAEHVDDQPALLTLRNEQAGFFRSIGEHAEAVKAADAALALVASLGLDGSEAHTTTLINAATAHRAAGNTADARRTYADALALAQGQFGDDDRRLAALHNNLSLALADDGQHDEAIAEQRKALAVLGRATTDPGADIDMAMTHTNMAQSWSALGDADAASEHATCAIDMFRAAQAEDDPHMAAALATHAATALAAGDPAVAVTEFEEALAIIERAYGPDSEAAAVTRDNLAQARDLRDAVAASGDSAPATASKAPAAEKSAPNPTTDLPGDAGPIPPATASARRPHVPGLELARRYWREYGQPMLLDTFPDFAPRIAAGLVGHGSECYGFDDAISTDHDFGVGFCWWLTEADHALIGADLQRAYEALPAEVDGYPVRPALAAHGQKRSGVFEIGAFFESLTGMPHAPRSDEPHLWLSLDEPTLAAATNGEVFADPHGAFGAARGSFERMPEDARLTHLSRRLGMMAQAGQYNVPRMQARGDGEAAFLAVGEFVQATASAIFLLNKPSRVGYLPYYKWQFAALRQLATQPLARLADLHGELSTVMRLASAASLGGAGFGEGGKGSTAAATELGATIARICEAVVGELRIQGLSTSESDFLEDHRPALRDRIADPWLRQQ